ncbi:MAG: Uracil-DNA glycosylase family protein, clostridial type [Firmicutes bacterium]|nr:Uracil-DNA glycosylase family protein, clostridial type [Bacillota bacterium]
MQMEDKAGRLTALEVKYRELLESYKPVVLGEGNPEADILMIGEAPGKTEVELKRPFVGQAGRNLDEFLEALELKREDLYITNAVKFRPTRVNADTGSISNRAPTAKEIEIFRPLLMDEIETVAPSVVVSLGNIPLFCLIGKNTRIGDVHGRPMELGQRILYPLYHPASIIYRRELKSVYRDDLARLKVLLEEQLKRSP